MRTKNQELKKNETKKLEPKYLKFKTETWKLRGFNLNGPNFHVYGASRYKVNMFVSEVFNCVFRSPKNWFLLGLFNGSAKPHNIFELSQKLKIKSRT